ncbi:MAG: hypothetical protein IIC93_12060 [Chloroflexi bacterium]|nr:hypothetical protein [Chloroflexota bacterium]
MAQEPMNTDSAAGKPSSRGMKIGFLLVGSPEKERVYAVLAALPLLEGVSTVRLAWSDASQAEFSGMSSFSASPGELIDRLSDELLHLPGFQVQIQGVNRVPYPVLVFRAEPGVMDRNAVRRRSTARTGLVQQEEARRGTARIDRAQAGTQPGRTGGAGVTPDPEAASPETAASGETPPETTWAPGLMASTVREPGFENVTPRLHPAARPRPDPIEPVVRSHYPRPSPVDETGQSTPGAQGIPDAREDDWLIDVSEETDESVPQDTETIGAVVLEPGELLEEDDTAWLVLVSDSYPDIEYPEQPSERLHTAVPGAVRGAVRSRRRRRPGRSLPPNASLARLAPGHRAGRCGNGPSLPCLERSAPIPGARMTRARVKRTILTVQGQQLRLRVTPGAAITMRANRRPRRTVPPPTQGDLKDHRTQTQPRTRARIRVMGWMRQKITVLERESRRSLIAPTGTM